MYFRQVSDWLPNSFPPSSLLLYFRLSICLKIQWDFEGVFGLLVSFLDKLKMSVMTISSCVSPVITNEPLKGLSWNCNILLSTPKWTAELFTQGCPIQDGRLTAIYGRNIFSAIAQCWIEILTLNLVRSKFLRFRDYRYFSKFHEFSKFHWTLQLWKNLKLFTE